METQDVCRSGRCIEAIEWEARGGTSFEEHMNPQPVGKRR
jgi:hypothetical protein